MRGPASSFCSSVQGAWSLATVSTVPNLRPAPEGVDVVLAPQRWLADVLAPSSRCRALGEVEVERPRLDVDGHAAGAGGRAGGSARLLERCTTSDGRVRDLGEGDELGDRRLLRRVGTRLTEVAEVRQPALEQRRRAVPDQLVVLAVDQGEEPRLPASAMKR